MLASDEAEVGTYNSGNLGGEVEKAEERDNGFVQIGLCWGCDVVECPRGGEYDCSVARAQERIGRCEEELQVRVERQRLVRWRACEHRPCITRKKIEQDDLAPFVDINEQTCKPPEVRMQQV